jgi:processive 1,2-diacylglycerol beta-glucosyltransferase
MIVSKVRRYVNWLHSRRLVDFLLDFRPDVVISTHFLATEVVSQLKKKGLTGAKLVNVVTDYRVHAFWVAPYADAYMVASEDTKMDLIRWRVDPSKINVTGIPVEPKFPREVEDGKIGLRAKLGLKEDIFTVLVVGGGFGMGPIERIVRILDELKTPLQAVVICGYNQKLKTRMIRLKGVVKVELREFGFVENMHEFMAASDILISKSGGITVTEALVMRLPMVVVSPIPGQETKNALFLVRHNAAMMVSSLEELAAALKPIINNRERLDRMRANIELIRHPSAAFDIASFAIGMDSDG